MRYLLPALTVLTTLSLCAFTGNSHAADALDAPNAPNSAEPRATPAAGDSLTLGASLAYVPEYAGADKSRVVPLPVIERTWDNGVFLSTTRGLGYQASVEGVNLSAALGYGGGRADHKKNFFSGSDALKGMGDIDGAAQLVLGASYKLGDVGLSLATTQSLSKREHGATYTLGASLPVYVAAGDQVGLGASATYGDDKHAQTYFGVTAAQSASAGYRAYQAKAGFESVNVGVNWNHVIDKHWSLTSALGAAHLTGDAADSPLTKRKTTPLLMTSLNYKF